MATNDGGHKMGVVIGSLAEEMAALESLGPLTRAAIANSPIRYCAFGILRQIRSTEEQIRNRFPPAAWHRIHLDPKEPNLDLSIAEGLKQDSLMTIRRDRSEEDALLGIKPMIPRYSVRSLREQRRTARRIRW